MPQVSSYEPGSLDPTGRVPGWGLIALLVFVVAVLLVLVFVPHLMRERTTEMRRELSEVATPLAERWGAFVRTTAAEESAIRSYAHTGDETYLQRFQEARAEAEAAASQLQDLAHELGESEVVEEARSLLEYRERWTEQSLAFAKGKLSQEEFQELLPVHRERYEAVLEAERRFDRALTRVVQSRRAAIQQAENRWAWLTAGLAFMAVVAVGAVLWLGRRMQAANRHVTRQVREQAELFHITQLLNEATDLEGALRRIARGVVRLARARGAFVEQINFERDEIKVVSTVGRGTPGPGTTAPYPGSLAEKVITSGQPEVTTVDTVVEEGHSTASLLSEVCPECRLLVVPLLSEDVALGVLLLNRSASEPAFDTDEVARIRVLADMAALILRRLHLFEQTRRSEEKLRQQANELEELKATLEERVARRTEEVHRLASELTLSEQRERHRIATMLHDELQQQLYGIRLDLGALRRRMEAESETTLPVERLSGTIALIEQLLTTMRHRAIDLSPPVLSGEGLVEALYWLRGYMQERFGFSVEVHPHAPLTFPKTGMRVLLFQIVRGLLLNAAERTKAECASITLKEEEDDLVVNVICEGANFAPEQIFLERATPGGVMGLSRARERLELFRGQIELTSPSEQGVRVTITVPVQSLRQEA